MENFYTGLGYGLSFLGAGLGIGAVFAGVGLMIKWS